MSEHRATISWQKETESFRYQDYNREHRWEFPKSNIVVRATAAPKYGGKPDAVDPEEALVASISSCHMLTFLALCAHRGFVVERYLDEAVGVMEFNEMRKLAVTRVVLKPRIAFAPGHEPDAATLADIHHEAHQQCFIANSVKTNITVEAPDPEVPR